MQGDVPKGPTFKEFLPFSRNGGVGAFFTSLLRSSGGRYIQDAGVFIV